MLDADIKKEYNRALEEIEANLYNFSIEGVNVPSAEFFFCFRVSMLEQSKNIGSALASYAKATEMHEVAKKLLKSKSLSQEQSKILKRALAVYEGFFERSIK